ncbi:MULTISPECIES: histidinol-phosphate transaminase [unclassified Halanaerobium]|uniref:histidinol-phosphate transaminase n=1 Tax=unclassified Halanaerobium TaxID=2641197 RepID=UPI000DF49EDF|nr:MULTISPECIES: histidinol-phosphate transaminase [unclassified Halanaerobium]RCW48292.1 histidinol-phosphate aminotransferase [Halanaerobium sp. MA284_MarDTE_T2]RCW85719.1 histidinol-phosphate aminotransferase [Halanaerobium sp. DL-01]
MSRIADGVCKGIKNMNRYQAGKGIDEVKKMYGLERIIKLASNENPYGPAREVINSIKDNAANINFYPDSDSRDLKNALSNFYNIEEEKIFIGNGSDEILDLLLTLFINPGDEAVQADPSFIKYELSVRARDGISVKVPLTEDYKHDLEAMKNKVGVRTKVFFLCNPNNPTGTVVPSSEIKKLLDELPENVLLIVDQAYYEYVESDDYFDGTDLLDKYPNLFILRTFSKIYGMAGMRVGYGFGSPEIVDYLNRLRSPFNVNLLSQKAALTALEAQEHVGRCRDMNKKEKKYLYSELEKMGLDYIETETNFMMINAEKDSDAVFKELMKRGVIVRSGSGLGMESWIRVTIGCHEENKILIEKLKEVV